LLTLAELAKLAGVSTATVSRSLAGHSTISKATRSRIVSLAREHGYRPNRTARALRTKRASAIGLSITGTAEQHGPAALMLPYLVSRLSRQASLLGCDLVLLHASQDDVPSDVEAVIHVNIADTITLSTVPTRLGRDRAGLD
jgi:DNA-binding LacI/PurR family transcriptional regulator